MFNSLKKEVRDAKRLNQIIRVLAKHQLSLIQHHEKLNPTVLREILEELSGTFVKLGQLLSLRPDLIPNEYCEELAKLQDSLQPVPYKDIKKVFDQELGKTKLKLGRKVLGSASIAQVHEGKIGNKKVVVKIIKPGIKKQFVTDLEILERIARFVKAKIPSKHFDSVQVFEEFKNYTEDELNLKIEYHNLTKALSFKHLSYIIIPKPYQKYSTTEVLTMQFIPGKKLLHVKTRSKSSTKNLVEEFWDQIFEHGFFHADPHPGNILVGKKVGLIDWGIVGELDSGMKRKLRKLFYGVILRNIDMITKAAQDLDISNEALDVVAFRRDMELNLEEFYGKNLEDLRLGVMFQRILQLVRKYNLKYRKDYILLMKCIITLEGTGLTYRKDFNIFQIAMKYVKKRSKKTIQDAAIEELHDFYDTLTYIKHLPEHATAFFTHELNQEKALEEVQHEIVELDRSLKKVSQEMLLIFGLTVVLVVSIILLPYKFGNIPALSLTGFLLSGAMFLQLIHFVLR